MTNLARRMEREQVARIATQLAALRAMTVAELQERYLAVYGEPSGNGHKDWLRKKVAWRIQELAEGGLSERAKAKIAELGPDAPVRAREPKPAEAPADPGRDPRLPKAGTVLRKVHGGQEHAVTVLDDGFEYGGATYKTLSAVARAITGSGWNGFLFFGLTSRARKGGAQ
jgi:hypothetical protein